MLKTIRKVAAFVCFTLITLLFLDITGAAHTWLGWLAKIQFLPALLGLHVGVVVALLLLTLIFGRIYCSVICPLGVFQDAVSAIAGKRKKNRFSYSPALTWLRYTVLVLFAAAIFAGISSIVTLLAPYSAYGRMVSSLLQPVYQTGNNLLAMAAERMGSYAFYEVDVWIKSLATLVVAAVTLIVVGVLAWRGGRTYCNTICPVGTLLGFFAQFSLYKPTIDRSKCNQCGLCSRNCKASCIDTANYTIDYSRCVDCMSCIDKCKKGALKYTFNNPFAAKKESTKEQTSQTTDQTRRNFISTSALLTVGASLKAQEMKMDGGLAVIEDKVIPKRDTPILPPGALSAANMAKHCTACQLCVSACPNGVLRPSSDLSTFMQPFSSYERGYCRPECTACSDVCPSGAIRPITKEEKSSTQIGRAVWVRKNCVVLTDEVSCGNCARHCPTGAITMVKQQGKDKKAPLIPVVNTEICIGCGACENLCPARPFTAIYVEGNDVQHNI